jgi:hypothetical protein
MRAGPWPRSAGGIANSVNGRPVGPRTGRSKPGSTAESSRCAVMERVYGGVLRGSGAHAHRAPAHLDQRLKVGASVRKFFALRDEVALLK